MTETIKTRIKRIIIDKCANSNKAFAERLNINVSTIQIWDDEHLPKGDILLRIKKEFGVNINWLLTGQGQAYIKEGSKVSSAGIHQIVDEKGLYGHTRHLKKEGKRFTVTEFTPPEGQEPEMELEDVVSLGRAVELLASILNSGNQVMIRAILSNLQAFSSAVDYQYHAEDRIKALENKCDRYEKTIRKLEKRIEALEKQDKDTNPSSPAGSGAGAGAETLKESSAT